MYRLEVEADGVFVDITAEYAQGAMSCPNADFNCRYSIDLGDLQTLVVDLEFFPTWGSILLTRLDDGVNNGGPAVVDVTLSLDGEPIGVGHYEPEYDVSEPNGIGCGFVTWASDSLLVSTMVAPERVHAATETGL